MRVNVKKPDGIVHYAIGQRYDSKREDGRRVNMIPIACQGTRVFLPKGHTATHSWQFNCKKCIEVVLKSWREDIERRLEGTLAEAVDDKTEFKITWKERGRRELKKKWFGRHKEEIDSEVLERIRHG